MTVKYENEPITEYLEIDLDAERWLCRVCHKDLGEARENYKRGLLLYDRDPRTVYEARIEGEYSYAPDPNWCRIVEYYCPGCGTQVEAEYLPPGHPLTHDIELDIDSLKERQVRLKALEAAAASNGDDSRSESGRERPEAEQPARNAGLDAPRR